MSSWSFSIIFTKSLRFVGIEIWFSSLVLVSQWFRNFLVCVLFSKPVFVDVRIKSDYVPNSNEGLVVFSKVQRRQSSPFSLFYIITKSVNIWMWYAFKILFYLTSYLYHGVIEMKILYIHRYTALHWWGNNSLYHMNIKLYITLCNVFPWQISLRKWYWT